MLSDKTFQELLTGQPCARCGEPFVLPRDAIGHVTRKWAVNPRENWPTVKIELRCKCSKCGGVATAFDHDDVPPEFHPPKGTSSTYKRLVDAPYEDAPAAVSP